MMDEWWRIEPKLRLVVCDADLWCRKKGVVPVWTCLLRTEEENASVGGQPNSVHLYGRGADMRLLGDDQLNLELIDYLNEKYAYDPSRPEKRTAMIHGPVNHIHIQTLK